MSYYIHVHVPVLSSQEPSCQHRVFNPTMHLAFMVRQLGKYLSIVKYEYKVSVTEL